MASVKLDTENLSFNKALGLFGKRSVKSNNINNIATPFIKWVGGKRSLLDILLENIPNNYNNYFEPFVGGGALFFALNPQKSTLSDYNLDLIITYTIIKNDYNSLIASLKKHQELHNEKHYYTVRKQHVLKESLEIAARFIYLNKTCYNGLYRVNSKGEFNVPMGKYENPLIADENNLEICHKRLKNSNIIYADFKKSLLSPQKDDFVYLDPPYAPIERTSFTKYSKDDFTEGNQIELHDCCRELHKKGVKFMMSNSDTQFIRNLYKDDIFNIKTVTAPRMVNCKSHGRSSVNEVLIRNYE